MAMRTFLFLALLIGVAAIPSSPADESPRSLDFPDIVYAQAGKRELKLDLSLPPQTRGKKPYPVVLYIHGGGWRVGNKAEGKQYAGMFTSNGIAFATIDYRLSNVAIWPAQIHDGKAAVRWLRADARGYNLDPTRIGVMGASAGGHLAALLGTTAGVASLEDPTEGNPKQSTRVNAVCDISGPVDLAIPTRSLIGKLAVRGELGGSAAERPDLVQQADPSRYVKGGEPPFLLLYGDKDGLVTPEHAFKLEKALRAHGDEAILDLVPGGLHIPMSGEKQRSEVVAFFKKHLRAR